jgi:GT2 family glycosyltransferase
MDIVESTNTSRATTAQPHTSQTHITFSTISRGKGKIFILVDIEGIPSRAQVKGYSTSLAGKPLPCQLLRLSARQWVLSVAVLEVSQKATVQIYDSTGKLISSAFRRIIPTFAKLSSQINTALDNPDVNRIRNCDYDFSPSVVAIRYLVRDSNEDVARCSAQVPSYMAALELSVEVLDDKGQEIGAPWVCLGDKISELIDYPGETCRTIDFSFRILAEVPSFVIWLRRKDSSATVAFLSAEPHMVQESREAWRNWTLPIDQDPNYENWFLTKHRSVARDLSMQQIAQENFKVRPLFSFIVPLYKTPLDFLKDMIGSVLAQTYPHFELILVDASPEDGGLSAAVARYCAVDSRIRKIELKGNLGITENTNAGIQVAQGDFLVFLDHDDVIEPDALYWYAKAIDDSPETDLLYCDEDHLLDGHYVGPFLKPDWDPDLLCRENYVCHMLAVRKKTLMSLGELPSKEFDGSQDHNLTFLIGEKARCISHVKRILYHWRMHAGSVAGAGIGQKSYALESERKAVQGHLDRCGIPAKAVMNGRYEGRCDVAYRFEDYPLVSIIIPSHEEPEVLSRCIESIYERTEWPSFEALIVENGSKDKKTFGCYKHFQNQHKNLRVVTCEANGGFNFSRLVNFGAQKAQGDFFLFLNNDTQVISKDWIDCLVGPALYGNAGCVGAKLIYPDGLIQHAGVTINRDGSPVHTDQMMPSHDAGYYECNALPHRVAAVTGACLLTPRKVFEQVGGFDEELAVDYNDIDYCMRVSQAGYTVLQQNDVVLYHFESVSRGANESPEQLRRFSKEYALFATRWGDLYAYGDPYYNPNFRKDNFYHTLGE